MAPLLTATAADHSSQIGPTLARTAGSSGALAASISPASAPAAVAARTTMPVLQHLMVRARNTATAMASRTAHALHVITLPRPTTRTRALHDRFLVNCGYPQAAIDQHWRQWYPHP